MPYSPWGPVIGRTLKQNQAVRRTPSMLNKDEEENLIQQGEIFGALWHYRSLKSKMVETINWGLKGGKKRPENLIECEVSAPHTFNHG